MSVILLDCDGVLADFVGGVVKVVNERLVARGVAPYDREAIVGKWHFEDQLGIEKHELADIAKAPGFCAGLQEIPWARQGVESLRRDGHELYCVTSPWDGQHWMWERKQWLRRFGFGQDCVVQCSAKHLLRADVLVDDKPSTIQTWAHTWHHALAIEFLDPKVPLGHRERERYPHNVRWCGDWRELPALIHNELATEPCDA